jgi:hypothetical protein
MYSVVSFFFSLLFIALFFAVPAVLPSDAIAQTNTVTQASRISVDLPGNIFMSDLSEGSEGVEVYGLQRVLNSDPETMILGTGAGSPGKESRFFGPATTDAVIRFQNKYANEVLRPVGLSAGTGFVGLWTRLKLNQIISTPAQNTSTQNVSTQNVPTQTTAAVSSLTPQTILSTSFGTPDSSADPVITNPSKYYGEVGDKITLSGAGFSLQGNTVHVGSGVSIKNVSAKSSNELEFAIPSQARPGKYEITVTNADKKTSFPISFMVTTPNAPLPVIESISPAQASFGKKIIITGKNFKPTGNMFVSHLGVYDNLRSPDGKTIELTIPLPEYLQTEHEQLQKVWFGDKDNLYWPVHGRVINLNGVSDDTDAAQFIINL